MSIISKQIGWSQESNLLYEILKQLNKLTGLFKPKYKVYSALLQQSSSTPPTAIVLQDDFNGDFTYTRDSDGTYKIISALQLFDPSKTFILIGNTTNLTIRDMITYNITNPNSEINLFTTDENGILKDNILVNTPIEIRVYN